MPGAETAKQAFAATEIAMGGRKSSIIRRSLVWARCKAECQPMPSFMNSAAFVRMVKSKSVTMSMDTVDLTMASADLTAMGHTSVSDSHST